MKILVLCWYLFVLAWACFAIGISVYGIYLAFCASVILGLISLFIQPAPLVFGLGKFFFGLNLPVMLMTWIHAHGG